MSKEIQLASYGQEANNLLIGGSVGVFVFRRVRGISMGEIVPMKLFHRCSNISIFVHFNMKTVENERGMWDKTIQLCTLKTEHREIDVYLQICQR